MQTYKNINGNSGVIAYKINAKSVEVKFIDGTVYVYDYETTGKGNIEKMKKLATNGKGLSTFISTKIKNRFASKH